MEKRPLRFVPGILLCVAIAALALWLAEFAFVKQTLHLGALLLVILVGMVWKSVLPPPAWAVPGIEVAQRPILRWGVALLGFKLSIAELGRIGGPALLVVVVSTAAALYAGFWIARAAGLDEKLGALLSVGGAICGASAIVAAESVVKGSKRDIAVSLATITLWGTVGILVYPWIAKATGMPDFLFGVWDGASLHEMAQVVAAGESVSDAALRTATVVKLARIALLAPVVLLLAWSLNRRGDSTEGAKVPIVPWFLVAFLLLAGMNSTGWLSQVVTDWLLVAGLWLLSVGMAGVGLQTGFSDLREAGWRPLLVGLGQWVVLALLSLGMAWLLVGSQ